MFFKKKRTLTHQIIETRLEQEVDSFSKIVEKIPSDYDMTKALLSFSLAHAELVFLQVQLNKKKEKDLAYQLSVISE